MMTGSGRCLLVSLFTVAGLGCGGGDRIYPIEGVVRLDGAPLEATTVTFQPVGNGQAAIGYTGPDGRFKASTAAGEGAKAGEYLVTLSKVTGRQPDRMPPWVGRQGQPATPAERAAWQQQQQKAKAEEKEWVPEAYRTTAKTPLRFTVPLKDELVIDLGETSEANKAAPASSTASASSTPSIP